jgi:diacylglycerol kinase
MRLINSFRFALSGLLNLVRSERNFQIHLIALMVVICLGWYVEITRGEWYAVLLISAAVLSAEGVNTAIEKLCDHVHPEQDEAIKKIKDVSAGAVLVLSIFALIIGVLIFGPYMK